MSRHLLIDGDIIAYQAAVVSQHTFVDDAGWHQPVANRGEGEAVVDNLLFTLKQGLKADDYNVYLSDPLDNWRKQVDPSYKANRKELVRPLLLTYLKDYIAEKYAASRWPGLEADDVLGIQATSVSWPKDMEVVVVGRDKDFLSIPGLHHTVGRDRGTDGKLIIRTVTQWEADRFHLMQTLAGDRVDGYYGCPGIGMERAAQIIDSPMRLVPKPGIKTRGINKGEPVTRWMGEPTTDLWAAIVSQYEKAGLSEREALVSARLARILRYGEYDRNTEEVTLWTPDKIRT
jgi:DNA polymerase-1